VGAIADAQGQGTIVDPTPFSVSIADVSATEGGNATFTVTLSAVSSQPVTVNFAAVDGTATGGSLCGPAGVDYVPSAGTLDFPADSTPQTITVGICPDALDEANETFFVNLTNPTVATIGDGQGLGTIVDDDTTSVSIADASANEGDAGSTTMPFTVSLSAPNSQVVTVNFATSSTGAANPATSGGACGPGADYVAQGSGTLTFNPGAALSQTVNVAICGDLIDEVNEPTEPNESFFVNLSGPVNATIADGQGIGTIVEDDAAVRSFVADVSLDEGNECTEVFTGFPVAAPCGTTPFDFTVTMSRERDEAVTVQFATAPGSVSPATGAASGSCEFMSSGASVGSVDYETKAGTLTFVAGQERSGLIEPPGHVVAQPRPHERRDAQPEQRPADGPGDRRGLAPGAGQVEPHRHGVEQDGGLRAERPGRGPGQAGRRIDGGRPEPLRVGADLLLREQRQPGEVVGRGGVGRAEPQPVEHLAVVGHGPVGVGHDLPDAAVADPPHVGRRPVPARARMLRRRLVRTRGSRPHQRHDGDERTPTARDQRRR
jgi:hypothetical protein